MKEYYFPPEIWRLIYSYVKPYKTIYNECITEMRSYCIHNKMISMMNVCFQYYNDCYLIAHPINNLSYLKYIIKFTSNASSGEVYSNPYSIVSHRNCWDHYIKKCGKRIYTKI